ncbi:MAG: GGDEF domain-containing protein [Enterobacterales bacterium]|nr:GGDEF domain-containing protein [Enterobacterales bacterium]
MVQSKRKYKLTDPILNRYSKFRLKRIIISTALGATLFVIIFSAQLIVLLDIAPPLILLIMPSLVGASAGFTLALWREKNRILVSQLLHHQTDLNETIKLKTLELEEKNKTLRMLSVTDSLTGLANRRLFDMTIQKEWNRSVRTNENLSLIMCDVDMFKQFNDTYGHQLGDNCLKLISEVLKAFSKRGGDIAVRYGGEEFCLILPNTELKHAYKIAQAINVAIENKHIPHKTSTVSEFVTASFGVSSSQMTEQVADYQQLIVTADQALYMAKEAGRNQVDSVANIRK